jgi:hypothetical protein
MHPTNARVCQWLKGLYVGRGTISFVWVSVCSASFKNDIIPRSVSVSSSLPIHRRLTTRYFDIPISVIWKMTCEAICRIVHIQCFSFVSCMPASDLPYTSRHSVIDLIFQFPRYSDTSLFEGAGVIHRSYVHQKFSRKSIPPLIVLCCVCDEFPECVHFLTWFYNMDVVLGLKTCLSMNNYFDRPRLFRFLPALLHQ